MREERFFNKHQNVTEFSGIFFPMILGFGYPVKKKTHHRWEEPALTW
jgi:hypothetical protein